MDVTHVWCMSIEVAFEHEFVSLSMNLIVKRPGSQSPKLCQRCDISVKRVLIKTNVAGLLLGEELSHTIRWTILGAEAGVQSSCWLVVVVECRGRSAWLRLVRPVLDSITRDQYCSRTRPGQTDRLTASRVSVIRPSSTLPLQPQPTSVSRIRVESTNYDTWDERVAYQRFLSQTPIQLLTFAINFRERTKHFCSMQHFRTWYHGRQL